MNSQELIANLFRISLADEKLKKNIFPTLKQQRYYIIKSDKKSERPLNESEEHFLKINRRPKKH